MEEWQLGISDPETHKRAWAEKFSSYVHYVMDMSLTELSKELCVNYKTVWGWASGLSLPDKYNRKRLSDLLSAKLDWDAETLLSKVQDALSSLGYLKQSAKELTLAFSQLKDQVGDLESKLKVQQKL